MLKKRKYLSREVEQHWTSFFGMLPKSRKDPRYPFKINGYQSTLGKLVRDAGGEMRVKDYSRRTAHQKQPSEIISSITFKSQPVNRKLIPSVFKKVIEYYESNNIDFGRSKE